MAIERQTIVTWYRPEEKHPREGDIVVATVSGKKGEHITYDHAFALVSWFDDGLGYVLENDHLDDLKVHGWCDLEPYKG